jgi:hypothetical protein
MNLINQITENPNNIEFTQVIDYIDTHYDFTPTAFQNGGLHNAINQNNGSCKIFSFAHLLQLTKDQTLALFGDYYRKDVLHNPHGNDHQNIRNFIQSGWHGIKFEGEALVKK